MQGEYVWNTSQGAFTAFRLIYKAKEKGTTIGEITKTLKANRSVISRQLMVLEKEDIVKVTMKGKTKIWTVNRIKIKKLLKKRKLNEKLMRVMVNDVCTSFDNFVKSYKAMSIILKKYEMGEY